jgi:hypothetical protein
MNLLPRLILASTVGWAMIGGVYLRNQIQLIVNNIDNLPPATKAKKQGFRT